MSVSHTYFTAVSQQIKKIMQSVKIHTEMYSGSTISSLAMLDRAQTVSKTAGNQQLRKRSFQKDCKFILFIEENVFTTELLSCGINIRHQLFMKLSNLYLLYPSGYGVPSYNTVYKQCNYKSNQTAHLKLNVYCFYLIYCSRIL